MLIFNIYRKFATAKVGHIPLSHTTTRSVTMKKKRILIPLIILIVFILYLNRDTLNPFAPDCKNLPAGTPKPAECQKPVKEVAPGFEL
ncbi:hypothetical protein Bresa_01971|uniref:Uncharacterized protein n=2 Tax=Brenneria salicis TaxID=55214 RepID=A0A366IAX4_9GAMM|nr:hypothetical protein [Brenneria salicis ATCC 15712 = DSM 30166]RBP65818.1 hypothetical protein DES54_10482 [Brenneria salicis ATCC 15712 = DSM 30166]